MSTVAAAANRMAKRITAALLWRHWANRTITSCQNRNPAADPVPGPDQDHRQRVRDVQLRPGAELDHSDLVTPGNALAGPDRGDHAAGKGPGNLSDETQPARAVVVLEERLDTLIQSGGIGQAGVQEPARYVPYAHGRSGHRAAVHVDVEDRQVDADANGRSLELVEPRERRHVRDPSVGRC